MRVVRVAADELAPAAADFFAERIHSRTRRGSACAALAARS